MPTAPLIIKRKYSDPERSTNRDSPNKIKVMIRRNKATQLLKKVRGIGGI